MLKNKKLLNSEMIISRGFMLSAQEMFKDGYKAIIRNLAHKYGDNIVQYLSKDLDLEGLSNGSKLQKLFEAGICAEKVEIDIIDLKGLNNDEKIQKLTDLGITTEKMDIGVISSCIVITTYNCMHHLGKEVREKVGYAPIRVCPVGIIGICIIENVLKVHVLGGIKSPSKYDKTGVCTIRLDIYGE
ncbi:MAG TPA: hypothetical protein EYP22_02775 [Methanosarcinales archaeon]|nr:hypothetical protein [Methanosarcinales archaeon]